ncbi:hypothetical protein WIW50_13075 [Flavobacteriaceae bacterium 3-367]
MNPCYSLRPLFLVALFTLSIMNAQESVVPALETLLKYPKVRDFTMSISQDEAYITLQSPLEELSVIARLHKENDDWSAPAVVSFSGDHKDLEPFLSHDGLHLYFASNRPVNDSIKEAKDFNIWFVERADRKAAWSAPINIGAPINTEHNEFYPALATNGNLYFTSDAPNAKGKDDIFFSEWKNGHYGPPVSMSDSINTQGYEFNAYVAPDESFLLFSGYNRKDGLGSGDMYISFRRADNSWSTAKNLGDGINSKYMDYCPFMDMASKQLYFTSRRSALDAERPKSIKAFEEAVNGYENGTSRIYMVSLKTLLSKQ